MKILIIKKLFFYSFMYLINVETVFSLEGKSKNTSEQVLTDTVGAGQFFQMFLGLSLIIVLILGLAWLIKRINRFQGNINGALKVLSIVSVGQREKIALIQVGEQQILIGVASGKVNTLLVLDEPIKNNESVREQVSFSNKLSAVIKGQINRS
ncbi:MAG: flagellar biosynthetic protein FliO [Thiohalomonadales bacterium]